MSVTNETSLVERLGARFGDMLTVKVERNEVTAEVAPRDLIAVATALRDEAGFRFTTVIDVCGVDYLSYGQTEWDTDTAQGESFSRGVEGQAVGRFTWAERPRGVEQPRRYAAVIHLLSVELNQRIRLRAFCEDDAFPVVPSITPIWPGADWFERETFDLYGIIFDGHPDLRRILTDYGFVGHPFRKDFPLIGNVEVRYDPEQKRVVYEPVSIEPRVLVPRTIRNDADLDQARAESADHWREN
ncbi:MULTISPECIES: NADH-quinone oxidoreductase subunit C [unclassified Luteibacter]|uniref:NADH-quinone oxidoreductase subunit C n=1 Tax=unclassified Luteibacter TaxID=2620188 RepID=UPI0008C4F831|nr:MULTISPECIES: NADH-quinone oxidoreductase subunit C [unclassified Luteibacter]MDR6935230.1 NADH-quinone oxidoreductase subunit C [Luteibacter sp. 3190]SEO78419.1 NADH-quinone oxidoreductase subunit C [Luteibacter sp. UNC138MFCol5.1]SEV97796.1 NADH dehydrogenase subunit C [Luteibacter sp. 329MFSha]